MIIRENLSIWIFRRIPYICIPRKIRRGFPAYTEKVVPGGGSLPAAEKIHIAPVRIMPTLGIFGNIPFYPSVAPRPGAPPAIDFYL